MLPAHLRPREKASLRGFGSLSEIELLAIFLKSGAQKHSALDLASDLIKHYKDFASLSKATRKELQLFRGIGEVKAIEILALFEFVKRINLKPYHDDQYKDETNIIKFAQNKIGDSKTEKFLIILFDNDYKMLSYKELYRGTSTSILLSPTEIVKVALKADADLFYCFHNHPSLNVTPSLDDKITTKRIKNFASLFNLKFIKHYVISKKDYREV
ncbi:RadC family protein [Candidatus Mycoplasma mahonii]|uniref:RadC family protein n=1 Tax=Candidatus Mycoplasma mahonii TaxID=3004105 RepID=UPI0026ED4582|nr:DNA repair protein RadC [Candidatus Mycoplasma mahonii]WKX02328.1 DNA repair protein RadC [Candidatus Mycoplasma mahonii]